MLLMSFLALAFNRRDEEQEQQRPSSVSGERKADADEEYNVRESRVDAAAMAEMASTKFDIDWPEGEGQQQQQQQRSGYSA